MPLKTKVLISSITNLSDARYATGMGVDFLGFSMNDEDTHFIGYTNYTAITTWLQDMNFAGEFNQGTSLAAIEARAKEFGFTTIITPDNSLVKGLKEKNYTIILKQNIDSLEEVNKIQALETAADYVVIESSSNLVLTQEQVALLSTTLPLLVGTEIPPSSIADWIEDLDAMADILEAIEID